MKIIPISYKTAPMSCAFMSIDKLDEDITFLADLLDSFPNLTEVQRMRVNNALKNIAATHRRIDDDVDTLNDKYTTADEERSELMDELEISRNTRDALRGLVDVPHLENDLYSALKIARDSGSETAFIHISILEQVHNIIEQLSRYHI